MLNRCTIQGRVATDIDQRRTSSGVSVCTFRVAVQRNYKTQSGDRETDFLNIVCWRGCADFVTRYFVKGMPIVVDGRLQVRYYDDQSGARRTVVEIVADNVYFDGPAPTHDSPVGLEPLDEDGELPFD